MESSQRPPIDWYRGERCDECGTRRWYNDEEGHRTCFNGHQDQTFIQTQNAEDEFEARGSQGRITRIRKELQAKQTRFVTGLEALKLFLSCYQIILRHQCWALIHDKKAPQELEALVRDLWALRLPRIYDKVGSRLRLDGEETEDDDDESSGPKTYSSQTDTTDAGDTEDDGTRTSTRDKRKELPSLPDSIVLLYMGLMIRRCPISIADLQRWAVREEIPFIRPLRLIPANVRRNLSIRWISRLETHHTLAPDQLNEDLRRMLYRYRHYQLSIPPLNYEPLLYRLLHDLALPLQLFTTVQHLSSLLSLPFTFPTSKHRNTHPLLPETQLLALLVVATKLYHPFSSPSLYARSITDPSYLTIDWPTWSAARTLHSQALRHGKPFLPGEQMSVRETDVFQLSDSQLDSYMDWYDRTWTSARPDTNTTPRDLPQDLVDMFPTTHPAQLGPIPPTRAEGDLATEREAADERLAAVVGAMKTRPIVSEERAERLEGGVARPGSRYEVFREEGELGGVAREFHEAVAERGAMSLRALLKAVGRVEGRLEGWKRRRGSERRRGRGGEAEVEAGGEDVDVEMEMG